MFSVIISVLVYMVQIAAVIIAASFIPILIFVKRKRKKEFLVLFLLCLALEIAGLAYLSCDPVFVCPKEYREFISEEKEQRISSFNSGIYSSRLPLVPVCIWVTWANKDEVIVETYYILFGSTEMLINSDGPTYLHTLH